jgi:uncharacterized protein (TIGR02594 family)
VFDEFGFIDAFGGGGADIAPIAFDSAPIADTAWTPSFDSSMMSPEMAMGGAGGFDGQMGDIVGALADAGRFDLIPPVMEAAGFDMSGPDPLAPLAQSPSEAMPSMPEAEALPVPSLMSLMTQPPEAPAFMAPWNPMGDLGQSTFNPSPLPQQPLVINPEQQYGAQSFDESGFTGPSYPVETHNLTWDQAEGLHKLGLLNGGWRGAPDLGIEAANSYEWGSQYAQPRENIPTSEYAPGGRADQVADQVTRALQGQSGAQSFDESGFGLPPLQHNDGGPFGSRGNVSSSDTSPDFNWVFGQPEAPAPSSIINDHFKGYEPTPQPDSFNDRFGAAYPATSFNDRFGSWPEQQQAAPLQHNDGGPPGSSSMAGMSDGPPATFGQPQAQVPLPQPRPADLGQPLTWQETVDKFNAGAKLETPGKGLSSNPNDATPPSTAGVPKDIVGRAEQLVKLGGSSAQLQKFMASQGYPKNSAWCGDFAASVLKSQGYTPPKGAPVASNWRNFGTEVQTPQPGDIAVRNTNLRGQPVPTGQTGSHVTMVKEYNADTGRFAGVGGNQTRPVSNYAADNFRFFRPDTQVASAQNQAPATLAMEANKDFSPNKPIPGDQATKLAGKPPLEETTTPPTATQTARVADAGQRSMTDMPQGGGGFPSLISSLFGGGQQQGGMPAIMGGGQGGGRNPFNDPGSLAAMELIVNSVSRAAPISGLADSALQSQKYADSQMSRQAIEEALVAAEVPRPQARALSYNEHAAKLFLSQREMNAERKGDAAAWGYQPQGAAPTTPQAAPQQSSPAPSMLSPNSIYDQPGMGATAPQAQASPRQPQQAQGIWGMDLATISRYLGDPNFKVSKGTRDQMEARAKQLATNARPATEQEIASGVVSPGMWFDATNKPFMPNEHATPDIKNYERGKKDPAFAEYLKEQQRRASKFGLNPIPGTLPDGKAAIAQLSDTDQPRISEFPQGFVPYRGWEKFDAGTHWEIRDKATGQIQERISKNVAETKAQEAQGDIEGKAKKALPNAESITTRALARIEAVEKHPGMSSAVGFVQGRLPALTPTAADFRERIEEIKATVFIDSVEAMRGLGALTEREGPKLEAAKSRLSTAKSEEDFKAALKDLKEVFQIGLENMRKKAGIASESKPASSSGGAIPPPPPGFNLVK